ncbi:MAG: hypothetical protein AB1589_15795 [Cyanobacteriota bacterium]
MKRLISSLCITGCLWAIANLAEPQSPSKATFQALPSSNLRYFQSKAGVRQNL